MNIALVGGSGFIGRHTARELIKHDHKIFIFDLVISKNFFTDEELKSITFMRCNALDYKEFFNCIKWCSKSYDAVYMFAAISDSKENHNDIQHAVNTNIMSITNTLKVCESLKIPRIIFSSTVWVYSVVSEGDYVCEKQNLSISNSDHIYTTCKLTCEAIIRNYCSVRNIDYTILRYGIAYGPGCHPDTVLSKFITNALENKDLTITGSGNTFRNFLYVTDHARGNRLALSEKAKNKIINFEGPEKVTLTDVANRVKQLHNKDIKVIHTNERHGDYKGKHVSNSTAKQLLGWEPKINFETGSKLLYEYKKENFNSSTTC